jgi:Zn finger protein HypA/HybF involved in hydrogenase expression
MVCLIRDKPGRQEMHGEPGHETEVWAKLHEYGLMEQVIATILDELKKQAGPAGGSSPEVVLKVGAMAVHSEAATRQAYEVLVKGTPLEHFRLRLTIAPATLTCGQCGFQGTLPEGGVDPHDPSPLTECPRCGAVTPVQGGRGVESIELRWE